ncbi:putative soluble pyridine nucleotide transhydrogenase [Phytophthora cinnamomi]|uniref:putative soluble pyridine nucleotide transhydrogenase n=1 Tax=Phytophthora cinnamomi TaxID=4785 RepID=UPI003559DBD6|nr:putative soluble pyridine nucleotide transhydrogenase [Phytophthora cinnamomi]
MSSRSRTPGFLTATLKLCAYHVVNVIFALVACGILSAGVCTAASLIPVCCIGLLIFQVLVYIVFSLAQWDINLGNYIAPAQQRAYASLLPPGRFIGREGLSGYRISPSLAYFSPLSLMAMLYFLLVKPVIGVLSFLSVLLVVAPTVSFITSLTSSHPGGYYDSIEIYGVGSTSLSRYPGMSLVGAICVTLVGVALMQLVAKISLGATRFFCCEKFAVTTRFAPYQSLANNGVASYGATFSARR